MNSFFKKIFKIKSNKEGFTLVELLVASSILVSALGAPLYVGIQGVIIATESKDKIIATYLAEEGIELIRNKRDTNVLVEIDNEINGRTSTLGDWRKGFSSPDDCLVKTETGPTTNTHGCTADRNLDNFLVLADTDIKKCDALCGVLKVKTEGIEDRYGYSSSNSGGVRDSIFTRTIKVSEITADELKVESIVTWTTRGTPKTIQVEEHIYSYGFP